jgi:hypothetical protein
MIFSAPGVVDAGLLFPGVVVSVLRRGRLVEPVFAGQRLPGAEVVGLNYHRTVPVVRIISFMLNLHILLRVLEMKQSILGRIFA